MDSEQKNKRVKVLQAALFFESLVSQLLAMLLDIDVKASKTMGNSSSSISFNSKVDLLLDIKSIDKDTKKKFISFMNIRNQFMHNIEASSFEKCIKGINGLEIWLLKNFPQKNDIPLEQKLSNCFDKLVLDLLSALVGVIHLWKSKIEKEEKIKYEKLAFKSLMKSVSESAKVFDEVLPEHDKKFKGTGKLFQQLVSHRFKLLLDDIKDEPEKVIKEINYGDFLKADFRMGTIISTEDVDGWKDYVAVIVDFSFAKLQSVIKKGKNFEISKVLNETVCAIVNVKDLPDFRGRKVECKVLVSENEKGEIAFISANKNTIGSPVR